MIGALPRLSLKLFTPHISNYLNLLYFCISEGARPEPGMGIELDEDAIEHYRIDN